MSAFTRENRIRFGAVNFLSPSNADRHGTGFSIMEATSGTPGARPYPIAMTIQEMKEFRDRISNWSLTTDASAGGFSFPAATVLTPLITIPLGLLTNAALPFTHGATELGFELRITPATYLRDGDDFYPSVTIIGSVNATGTGGAHLLTFSDDPSSLAGPATGSITATIWGRNITVHYYAVGDGALTSMSISPESWFAYCAEDESPIYDTATGAPLQDPRN